MDKKVLTAQDLIAERAMDILRPVYMRMQTAFDGKTGEVVENFVVSDPVRKELLETMTHEAAGLFIKNDGLYAGVLSSVANDYAEGVSSGLVPGLCYKEDTLAFYNRHAKYISEAVVEICDRKGMYLEEVPGFDPDRMLECDSNNLAVTKFVVDDRLARLRSEVQAFRDDLEKIPRLRAVAKAPQRKTSLRIPKPQAQVKKADKDNSVAM